MAALLGQSHCDVQAVAVVTVATESYGVIGLDWVSMKGSSTTSYWSSGTGGSGQLGNVASNGNITLGNGTTINGDARPGIGMSVTGGVVTGTREPLTKVLSFPPGDAGVYATNNDNNLIPQWAVQGDRLIVKSNPLTISGGNYYFRDVEITTNASVTFTGPTTIYCWGNFTMTSQTKTAGSLPKNLTIVMCPGPAGQMPGALSLTSGADLYASVYAPQSPVTVWASGDIFGAILGKSVDMGGSGKVHYDLSLHATGPIGLVK